MYVCEDVIVEIVLDIDNSMSEMFIRVFASAADVSLTSDAEELDDFVWVFLAVIGVFCVGRVESALLDEVVDGDGVEIILAFAFDEEFLGVGLVQLDEAEVAAFRAGG